MKRTLLNTAAPLAAIALVTLGVAACTRAADMTCDQIAQEARRISQEQPLKFNEVRDVREVSRTDNERRCTGTAVTTTGQSIPLEIRGYEENGNQMVSYQNAPSAGQAPPPAGAAPPAGAGEQPPEAPAEQAPEGEAPSNEQ